MAQYARPDSDVSTGSWTANGGPSTLYECLDEVTASDTDYVSETGTTTKFEVGLSNVTDPAVGTGHILRWRWGTDGTGAKEKASIRLRQGTTTTIAGIANQDVPRGGIADASITLSEAEADAITDYTDLRVDVTSNALDAGETIQITWVELEVPDASGANIDESVTLAKYTAIAETTFASVPGATTIAKFAAQSAATLLNAQETITQAKYLTTTPLSEISGFETVSLGRDAALVVLEAIFVAPIEESVTLARFGAITPAYLAEFYQDVAIAKFNGITSLDQVIAYDNVNLARSIFALTNSQVSVEDALSLARSIFAAAAANGTLYDALTLAYDLGLTVLEEIGGVYESVILSKVIAAIAASQVNVEDSVSLNRINTVPSSSLGNLYDLATLARFDAISVLEETQGQLEESVTLAKFMDILTATQLQGQEAITLAQSIGTGPATLSNVGEILTLQDFRALTVFETTQGQTEESVILAKLMGIASTSQVVGGEAVGLNSLYGLTSSAQNVSDEILTLSSSYGLSIVEESELNAAVALARSNNISLATNVSVFDSISLLTLLLILATPSSAYVIENAPAENAVFIRFRDKRYPIVFRDKRHPVIFRDKRAKGGS